MRNRYVIQVLLATFGFGLLLAAIAVLQTPADWSLQNASGSSGRAELRGSRSAAVPTQVPKTMPRTDDFRDECELPAKLIDDCPQPEPQKICQRTHAHPNARTLAD